jgi:hypothetical protein
MPVVGENRKELLQKQLRAYESDPMRALAEQFVSVASAALSESGVDIYRHPDAFFLNETTREAMRDLFVNESYDPNDPRFKNDPYAVEDHEKMMNALFENDISAITSPLSENAPLAAFNPVIGMALPMHKNLTFNCVFEQVIPKDVAQSPKFTLTMEYRYLVDTNGNEIDIFLEQNKLHDAIANSVPTADVVVPLPEDFTTNIITTKFGGVGDLSIKTCITGVVVNSFVDTGVTYIDPTGAEQTGTGAAVDQIVPINELHFTPHYGDFDYVMFDRTSPIKIYTSATAYTEITPVINGAMKDNMFMLNCADARIKSVVLHAVADVSSAKYKTCYSKWKAKTDIFEIPEAPHLSVPISPEEIKDINALYQVNQVTKLMSILNISLRNWKDDEIHNFLDNSFKGLPDSQKFQGAFDFVPPSNFLQDPVSWRQAMFMDQLDSYVTSMLQVLNDNNMTISIVGRPDIIRRITPTQNTYTTPSSIGPVELEFKKTVVTSDKRVYQFISTDKMRNNNNLIILLIPHNSNRVMYKLFDYQFYVSNEIRAVDNVYLPAVTAFERYKIIQYQPVQGRLTIVNPRGLREVLGSADPIGTNDMNDYTANRNTYASNINGAVTNITPMGNVEDGKW